MSEAGLRILAHGEKKKVFVLEDGGIVDFDLGNYERFLDVKLHSDCSTPPPPPPPQAPFPQFE